MGLYTQNLGPADQHIVNELGREIITTLRVASDGVNVGNARVLSWFGNNGAAWIAILKSKLNQMRTVINLQEICISGTRLADREVDVYAAAAPPADGWNWANPAANVAAPNLRIPGFVTRSNRQLFQIQLNLSWNNAPDRRTPGMGDSKFQTLVHELSHLTINTDDKQYGFDACQLLAGTHPLRAQINADTWGYFVEEFRQPG